MKNKKIILGSLVFFLFSYLGSLMLLSFLSGPALVEGCQFKAANSLRKLLTHFFEGQP